MFEALDALLVMFEANDAVANFHVEYAIHASNQREARKGALHFIFGEPPESESGRNDA
jgi:hypothetical protein